MRSARQLLSLVSVLAFGAILGPFGVLLAVPAAAIARTFLGRRANEGKKFSDIL